MVASWMAASQIAATDPSLCKIPLGETGYLGNPYFTYWLPKHQVFDSPLPLHSQLGYLWLPTPHCAAPM